MTNSSSMTDKPSAAATPCAETRAAQTTGPEAGGGLATDGALETSRGLDGGLDAAAVTADIALLRQQVMHWRRQALRSWASAVSLAELQERLDHKEGEYQRLGTDHHNYVVASQQEIARLQQELADIRASLSWRMTSPVRTVSTATAKLAQRPRAGKPE